MKIKLLITLFLIISSLSYAMQLSETEKLVVNNTKIELEDHLKKFNKDWDENTKAQWQADGLNIIAAVKDMGLMDIYQQLKYQILMTAGKKPAPVSKEIINQAINSFNETFKILRIDLDKFAQKGVILNEHQKINFANAYENLFSTYVTIDQSLLSPQDKARLNNAYQKSRANVAKAQIFYIKTMIIGKDIIGKLQKVLHNIRTSTMPHEIITQTLAALHPLEIVKENANLGSLHFATIITEQPELKEKALINQVLTKLIDSLDMLRDKKDRATTKLKDDYTIVLNAHRELNRYLQENFSILAI